MRPPLQRLLFETLYRNKYLYRFASTVPFAGQWRIWQRQVVPRLRGQDILEMGCGLGDLLADMLIAGYACHAVEHSRQMVAAARETLQKRHVGSPDLIMQGSAQNLPFPVALFDTVVSTFPSEYIYDPETIAEVERVLRPGGRLIVVEGANLLPVGFLQPILLLLQALVYGPRAIFEAREKRGQENESEGSQPSEDLAKRGKATGRQTDLDVATIVVDNASFGRNIPLERFGLHRRSEIARSTRWEVYITIGEKLAEPIRA